MSVEITVEQLVELLQRPLSDQMRALSHTLTELSGRVEQGQRDLVRRVEILEADKEARSVHRSHSATTWGRWSRVAGAVGYLATLGALWIAAVHH